MQDYTINWPVIVAIVALVIVAWLVSGIKDWAERDEDDD